MPRTLEIGKTYKTKLADEIGIEPVFATSNGEYVCRVTTTDGRVFVRVLHADGRLCPEGTSNLDAIIEPETVDVWVNRNVAGAIKAYNRQQQALSEPLHIDNYDYIARPATLVFKDTP